MSEQEVMRFCDDCTLLIGLWTDPIDGNLYAEFVDGKEWLTD